LSGGGNVAAVTPTCGDDLQRGFDAEARDFSEPLDGLMMRRQGIVAWFDLAAPAVILAQPISSPFEGHVPRANQGRKSSH
jgi:hypothetical protein